MIPRLIGGVILGLVIWMLGVTVLNFGLRFGLPGYAAVEKAMAFTLVMMIARLSISAIASLASGYGAAWLGGRRAAMIAGVVLLIIFLPIHYYLFDKFPIWYHLTFLISLPVLSIAGGRLRKT